MPNSPRDWNYLEGVMLRMSRWISTRSHWLTFDYHLNDRIPQMEELIEILGEWKIKSQHLIGFQDLTLNFK